MTYKFGIIGLGNMGSAFISRLLAIKFPHFDQYYIYDLILDKSKLFMQNTNVIVCENEIEVCKQSDFIFIAIKPFSVNPLLAKLKPLDLKNKVFVSILAGTPISKFETALGSNNFYIRAMPNIAFQIGQGASGITNDPHLDAARSQIVKEMFDAMGLSQICEENELDIVTGLSGSGPAYIFMIIEAMADGAVKMGLNREKAYKLAAQTCIGAGALVLESGKHPGQLKDMVTTPGGTTIDAIASLERSAVRSLFIEAVEVATRKAQILSNRK